MNEWRGGGDIPAAARAVLSEAMLSWTDYATWNRTALTCDWRIETHAMTEAVRCAGPEPLRRGRARARRGWRSAASSTSTRRRSAGVPRFLAGTIGRTVEEFMVSKIQSNLVETAKSLTKYLEENKKG